MPIPFHQGYQAQDTATSSVITKVKGVAVTCSSLFTPIESCPPDDVVVWDTADYVVPSQESNAFFIVSNVLETPGQTQAAAGWDEDPEAATVGSQKVWECKNDTDCRPIFAPSRNGALTGECNTTTERCRVYGWGPVELSALDDQTQQVGNYSRQMPAVQNYTVFIKNNIFFPKFKQVFTNTGKAKRQGSRGWLMAASNLED